MKIWKSFSGEHSARLRIIGTFKTSDDAKKAESLFNRLLAVEDRHSDDEQSYTKEMLDFFMTNNFSVQPKDIEDLDYFSEIEAMGNKIVVHTDDWALTPLMQTIIYYGGKVEVYSRHNED